MSRPPVLLAVCVALAVYAFVCLMVTLNPWYLVAGVGFAALAGFCWSAS